MNGEQPTRPDRDHQNGDQRCRIPIRLCHVAPHTFLQARYLQTWPAAGFGRSTFRSTLPVHRVCSRSGPADPFSPDATESLPRRPAPLTRFGLSHRRNGSPPLTAHQHCGRNHDDSITPHNARWLQMPREFKCRAESRDELAAVTTWRKPAAYQIDRCRDTLIERIGHLTPKPAHCKGGKADVETANFPRTAAFLMVNSAMEFSRPHPRHGQAP